MSRVRFCEILLIGAVPLLAQPRSLYLTPGLIGSATLPNRAPYNALTDWRIEARLTGCSQAAGFSGLFAFGTDTTIRFGPEDPSVFVTASLDLNAAHQYATPGISFKGRTDFLVRFQRDTTKLRLTAEIVNTDGSGYVQGTPVTVVATPPLKSGGTQFVVGGANTSCRVAYLRWYSSAVAPGTAPSTSRGDLGDWEFENNSNDRSGHNLKLSWNRTPTYEDTPVLPPVANAGPQRQVIRAGSSITLDGSNSFSPQQSRITYLWEQTDGPLPCVISDPSAAVTGVSGATVFGTYVFRLTVSEAFGPSSSTEIKVGAVPTDDHDIVIMDDPVLSYLLGPLTRWGTSPWPWFDQTEKAVADLLGPAPAFNSGQVALPGTVHVEGPAGAKQLVCDDPKGNPCNFARNFHIYRYDKGILTNIVVADNVATATVAAQHGLAAGEQIDLTGASAESKLNGAYTITAVPSPTTLQFAAPAAVAGTYTDASLQLATRDNYLWIWWDAPGDHTGRAREPLLAVIDDSHLVLAEYTVLQPLAPAGLLYSKPSGVDLAAWGFGGQGGNNNWNYYDNVLAFYRLYYRTGIDDYLRYARTLADNWWIYGSDHGYSITAPRVEALHGMMVRASDSRPEMWPGIGYMAGYLNPDVPAPVHASFDARESGYALKYNALVAKLAAKADGTPDTAIRARFCKYVSNAVQNLWAYNQAPDGSWPQDQFIENPSYPYAGQGMLPYQIGLGAWGLWYAYQALQDPAGCHQPEAAATALSTMGKALEFAYTRGVGKGRGLFYAVNYYAVPWTAELASTSQAPGSVSVTKGSTEITGSAETRFRTTFKCNNTDYIGIYENRKVFKVVSCAGDHTLTIDSPYPDASKQVSGYQLANAAFTECAPSQADYCLPTFGDRSLNHDLIAPMGAYYAATGDKRFLQWGDDLFAADYGGTAPPPSNAFCPHYVTEKGPGGDGTTGNFGDACVYGVAAAQGKQYGFSAGAGGAQTYLAFRLGALPPASLATQAIRFDLSKVPQAARVRVTVAYPHGSVAQRICSSSPCNVKVNRQNGEQVTKLEYLSARGDLLASETPASGGPR